MVREISFEKVYPKTHQFILIKMKFVSHFLYRGSVHASKIGLAQNIQSHICLKSERVF